VGRRGRRRGSQGRAEGRVRGRVRERVRGRGDQGGAGRRRGTFDMGAIEGYADRLTGRGGGTPGLSGAASGLAGAASGLAGGSLAHRIMGSDTEGSEEDFRAQVNERLDLVDERLLQLEEQMRTLLEGGGDLRETGDEPDPHSNQ
jgi:hypothetical protein